MKPTPLFLAFAAMLSLSFPAAAGDVTGAKKLICAPRIAIECEVGGGCENGSAESINFPQFIRIDLAKRVALGEAADGKKRSSKILNVIESDGATILQGAQLGRGWSAVIDNATGKLVVTVSAADFAFVVFGSCTTG